MKARAFAALALSALAATGASAQSVGTQSTLPDLTGVYQCVRNCVGAGPAQITQRGVDLYVINEAGEPARAWIDWPGHIWIRGLNEGAVYSPDGFTIQFNNGTVWVLLEPLPGAPWR